MKNIILLIVTAFAVVACASNSPPNSDIGIDPTLNEGQRGWSKKGNNLQFNVGKPHWDFKNSHVGKATDYISKSAIGIYDWWVEDAKKQIPTFEDAPEVEAETIIIPQEESC